MNLCEPERRVRRSWKPTTPSGRKRPTTMATFASISRGSRRSIRTLTESRATSTADQRMKPEMRMEMSESASVQPVSATTSSATSAAPFV